MDSLRAYVYLDSRARDRTDAQDLQRRPRGGLLALLYGAMEPPSPEPISRPSTPTADVKCGLCGGVEVMVSLICL